MPLTRLDNLISSKTGKYLYVSPDDFNATDALSNRGNSPITPFKSIQRAFLEIARFSYLPGFGNDRFDQFSIMLMPGIHYIDNRPGLVDTTGIDEFAFDQVTQAWGADPILDISNPDNVLYKFNNTEGGAIIPRGSSLVGYDLRRTTIRPMYVPDPATTEREIPRSAIFNVTGGCYFWQFTIKDGQTTSESPLYDASAGTGKVYYDPTDFTRLAAPNFSHHKLTVFEYADKEELALFYRKIAKAFSRYQPTIDDPGEFDFNIQENRIVGPLSDSRVIESLKFTDATTDSSIAASTSEIEVTTKVDHGYFQGQFVAIANTEIDTVLEGIFQIKEIDQNNPRKFTYEVPVVVSAIGTNLSSGETVSQPTLGQNAQTLAEVDSVESASPYVFNVSIRSTWGICGIWANGLKATGFKSMVIAQYTGVSLQKDDRAFIRYDEYSNTWNQASLADAFATVPYHTKGDSYWKDEWRNFHVRASDDAFIQNVSIFAVGFADHFLMESGGDMSITNSNSNFGNTSLHAIGFKGFAFNQDKGGYITDIIPPKQVQDTEAATKKVAYYTVDIQGTLSQTDNYTKLFLGSDDIITPTDRPAATIDGFRIGAKSNEELYVKLSPAAGTDEFFNVALEPTGFVKYLAKGAILNPSGGVVNSVYADAANLIESNRRMIQEEVFGYILEKYPRLQNISYVNPGLNPAGNRYFDARNLILANRQEIVNTAFDQMVETFGIANIQGVADGKCKRDIGFIVDAIAEDLRDGGNSNIIDATKFYFDGNGDPINNGLVGEEAQSLFAFNRARDLCKKAVANLLTVKADLYDPDPNSNLTPYGINAGYTGSAAEEAGLTTNGVTIDISQKQDPAGRYKDARNRIVANREFILDAALAEISVYHPDFYIPGDTQTNSQSRLADGFRLIRRNSSEIRDKALASIAISHPNFYIPGDQQTDAGSRYASAYRLIQNNRDEIVDTGLAQIAIGHPDFYIPGDQETDARSRYADAYRLIQQNKAAIVNTAWGVVNAAPPNPAPPNLEDKCRRDIGYFVDAISLDLFVGGNKYARKFISEYFNAAGNAWITGGLQGETAESIAAFNSARDQMKLAVANQLAIQDLTVTEGPAQYGGGGGNISRTNSGACDDVQSAIVTLTDIVTAQVAAGNLSGLPAETSYIAGPGETKCRRDIGYFVDALALDLFKKGNVYTWRFCAEYFSNASTQISDGLAGEEGPSKTAFAKAAEMMKKAVSNQLYEKDLFRTADNAPGSDYGQVTRSFTPHGATYDPNTGITVLSIANHDLSVGDYITLATGSLSFTCDLDGNNQATAYPRATDPVAGQYIEITAATTDTITVNVGDGNTNFSNHTFVSAATDAVTFAGNTANQLTTAQPALCSDVQAAIDTLNGIVQTVFTQGNLSTMPTEVNYGYGMGPGESKCARDIGYFIDAISVDMFTEGNRHSKEFTRQYFTNATTPLSNGLVGEEAESVTAFQTAVNEMKKAVYNGLYYKDLTVTEGNANYNGSYPPVGTPSAATYNPATGVSTITIANHGLSNGDQVKFKDNSFTFTCDMDGNVSQKTYPRQGDGNFDTAMAVSNVTTNTFDVNVGTSPIVPFNVTAADYEPSTGVVELTIGSHSLVVGESIKLVDESLTFTCAKDNNQTQHSYPRTLIDQDTITTADYDPATGVMTCTIPNHGWKNGDLIKFDNNSVTFTCTQDNNQTPHSYPRAGTDPFAGKWIPIYDVTSNRFRVQVGVSGANDQYAHTFVSATANGVKKKQDRVYDTAVPITAVTANTITINVGPADSNRTFSPTFATYNPTTGLMEITIGANHGLDVGEGIVLADNSFTFTCDLDNNATQHTYPRPGTDPYAGRSISITAKTATTITVNVGTSSDTSVHTFVSATANAVRYSPLSAHTFVSATAGAVRSGGNYTHTFVSAATDAVLEVVSSPVDRQDPAACSDVQAALDTLGTIVTDAITNGNITGGIWNSADNTGTFITGEAKCRRDIGHVVDAIAQDLWFGGNEYTLAATKEYFNGNSLITNGVDNEVGPAITAFKRAADLMNRAANNQYYDRDLNITLDAIGDPTIVGDIECDAHRVVLLNKAFIAEEAYRRMLAVYPTYTPGTGNTKQDCLDDVMDVLEEVMWDVKFGGNSKTYDSAKIYVTNVFNGATVETFIDAERDEAARVFTEAKNIAIQVINNETVTVSAGNPLSQIKDPTMVEDWDAGELLPRCGSAVAAVDTLMGMIIQAIGTDSGVGTLTATRTTGNPAADPAYDTAVNLTAVTTDTLSFNVGTSTHIYPHTFVSALAGAIVSGGAYDHRFVSAAANSVNVVGGPQLTPTNATYDPATGDFTMYFGSPHGVTTSNQVSLDDNGFTFKCAMDGYTANKTYPRAGSDPISGQNTAVTAATATSFTINVGTSPLVEHNVTGATYDPASGLVVVTTSAAHNLTANTSIKIKTEGLTFRCTKDQGVTTHSYPRASRANQPTAYAMGNCADVLQTIDTLVGIVSDALYAGNLNNLPPLSNGNWDCANVRSTIENLFDIFTDAISNGTINNLPPINKGDFTTNNEASKCFRDVSYIVDAVVNDLRLGGNQNSIQAGEAYYVGNSLTYIDGEKTETLDAWDYVGQLATAAMRNFDVLAYNCSTTAGSAIVDVNDTRGIVIGMSVKEYDNSSNVDPAYVNGLLQDGATALYNNIPEGAYVKRIVSNTQIELGVKNSRLNEGNTVNAQLTSSTTELYFVYEEGIWADTLPTTVTVGPENTGPDVIQDTLTSATYRECSGTADAIETLIGCITTIINSGLGTVSLQEQTVNTALLASRATVFTIDTTGLGPSNPHNFETGTPVRLVPRPRFDSTTGKYVDVDKRLVRLPNGFETNRTYYVIAPGRVTQPEDFSGTSFFNGADQTKLMLATSKENAAAGIYIYASETDSIDKDVEIDLYQFILDDKYDLHNYTSTLASATFIQTDVSHVFDLPSASTTPQKVFFRASEGGQLPAVSTTYANNANVAVIDSGSSNFGKINPNKEFFARYQTNKRFTIHLTHADAINNVNPISFVVTSADFQVYANKRRTPMKFDPSFTDGVTDAGKWYIQCKDQVTGQPDSIKKNNIFWRINQSDYADTPRSTDMWYERLDDTREADERTYKIRFVIPKYLENARDPINGFVLKTRTDDTRRLVPQKVLLKPVTGTVYGARFENPVQAGERIGFVDADFTTNTLNTDNAYDPYKKDQTGAGTEYRAFARFASGVQATIQSGRYVADDLDPTIQYLELTLFDHTIDTLNFSGLSNEILTTVKITAPQGGIFVANKTKNGAADDNAASFAGNSSGNCSIHAYYTVNGEHYLIIKNIRDGILEYSEFTNTRFTQGNVFADMLEDQDMGKSLPLKTHIRKNYPQYFYKQNGANVYTITPGDRIQDSAGVEYYVDSVEDAGVIEDTFYIFGYETLQRRIAGQQDGIYYLTALRGNISPFPTGAGVTNNFKKFKFSQPVSKLYPLNYRNDPLWFKNNGTTQSEKDYYANLIDPPQAYSAADNYIHGLVTVNDFKGSTTRELVEDLINNPAFIYNTYTGENQIRAQQGNATSGSEDRRIPIAGDSLVVADQRYYVELRRPSIARAGNHTFEYLGFGPGNYSTGLPARQEVVLTPDEDFYAQSKKQDGGIVFYTGINSQGDLYIGNRRINAITGEETFIDRATLADDGDEDDVIGGLVTTFDTPVTFNQNITIVGGDGSLVNSIESPFVISVQDGDFTQVKDSLIIRSNVASTENGLTNGKEQDERLNRVEFTPPTAGDITLSKNKVKAAVFEFTPIRYPRARGYKFFTHAIGAFGSNQTPNQSANVFPTSGGTRLTYTNSLGDTVTQQKANFGGVLPVAGDFLFKGAQVNLTGSLGWVFADGYTQVPNATVYQIISDGSNRVKISWRASGVNVPNSALGISDNSQIRITDYYPNTSLNGTWFIVSPDGDAFSVNNNYVHIQLVDPVTAGTTNWSSVIAGAAAANSGNGAVPTVEFSNSLWKECGVLGAEALRTETSEIGDFKLGINTVARAAHSAFENAWTSNDTTPRANLDVVGTAFISGRTTDDFNNHSNFADRDKNAENNAFLVGGDSAAPNDEAVFRIATTNGGRVGINVPNSQLDRVLVVDGLSRFTDDARFEHDIEVNGDNGSVAEIRTSQTTGTVNLFNDSTFVGGNNTAGMNLAGWAKTIKIGSGTTANQWIYIGDTCTGDQFLRLGNSSDHSNIFLGDIADTATYISKVQIGGAYGNNSSNSYTLIGTRQTTLAGDLLIGANRTTGGDETNPDQVVTVRSEAGVLNFFTTQTQTVNFATNASLITIGGQGGTTTVRNNFVVDANARFNADIKLCGGNASYSFEGLRGQLGTDDFAHPSGVLGQNTFNSNIDIINVGVITVADFNSPTTAEIAAGFNRVDTAGAGVWGGTNFQESKTGAGAEGADLPAITGDEFYLPMKYKPTPYFQAGDYLLIDTAPTGSGNSERYPELVRITEDGLQGANTAPFYLKVKRHPLGSFTKYKLQQLSPAKNYLDNHQDATNVWKCNIAFDATWTTTVVDATGPVDNFYLSQFGGGLTTNDYVIVDREDTNNDGDFNQGEIVKVQTQLDQVSKKLIVTRGCDTANETNVFIVDSVTGDITIGDQTDQDSTLNIYGSLELAGGCGATTSSVVNDIFDEFAGTSDDKKLTLTNRVFPTFEVNTCMGDTVIGNQWGHVWALQAHYQSSASAHTTSEDVIVYTEDPQTIQADGPKTLLASTLSGGQTQFLVVNSITGFSVGDLVLIYQGTTKAEFIRITAAPYIDSGSSEPRIPFSTSVNYPSGGRAQETTTAQSFTVGAVVVKVQKDTRTTKLATALPATGRTQAPSPNTNPDRIKIELVNGDLVAQKLDYPQVIRIGSEFFLPDSIDGNVDPAFGVKMPKSIRDSYDNDEPEANIRRYFGGGRLRVHDDLNLTSGNFRMFGTDAKTLVFAIANDDGHPGDGAILDPVTGRSGLYLNGRADIYGQLRVFKQTCQENGVCSNDLQFRVDNQDGSVEMGSSLYHKGKILANESSSDKLVHIDNIGSAGNTGAGPKDFIMYQDGSIDAFGISRYLNSNGGRRWTYLAASTTGFGQVVDNPLQPNGNYLCNPSSSGNMVVYLPSDAQTGDMIRFIDITGNLSYNANLIVRALPIGTTAVPIQGDSTGTKAVAGSGAASAVAWNSGELIVQTRNASFGLVYVGASDAVGDPNASEIPTDLRGWWLMEL